MVKIKLKSYKRYLRDIKEFAKALKIEIVTKSYTSEGAWIPSRNRITIDKSLTQSESIATLLHELGHALDDIFLSSEYSSRLDNAYVATYKNKYTDNQQKLVIECEKRAWILGAIIAKQLAIPLGIWYYKSKKLSLKSYRQD